MSRSDTSFLIFHKRTLLALIFLSAFSLTVVYAAPRITQYTPGETLDPDCAPGESNCSVEISSTGGENIYTTDGTLTANRTLTGGGFDMSFNDLNAFNVTTAGAITFTTNDTNGSGFNAIAGTTQLNVNYNNDVNISTANALFALNTDGTVALNLTQGFELNSDSGVAGQVLTSNGVGVAPSWQDAGGSSPVSIVNTSSLFSTGLSGTWSGLTPEYAIYLGESAGQSSSGNNNYTNFFGRQAGRQATNATGSNFFGGFAGASSSNASSSNFFGISAGYQTSASASNFFGEEAGNGATNASSSNFFGQYAGKGATNASLSNLFGFRVGGAFSGNNIGSNNIIIGTSISLPDATANAINIGGVLFGTGTHSSTAGDPSITPISGGRIGIGVVSPSYTLQVGNSGVSGIVARFENSAGTCDINPTSASLSCSSDETLKKDIVAVDDDMLEKILSLQPVTYHWNSEDESSDTHIGFIAQQVEEVFPDLVTTDRQTGLKSLNYTGLIPYTVKAVQELDLKVADINALPGGEESATFADKLTAWLANASNHITRIFTGEVCLTDTDGSSECLNKAELTQLKALLNGSSSSEPSTPSGPEPPPEEPTDPVVTEPTEETPPEVVPEETPEVPSEPSESISEVQS